MQSDRYIKSGSATSSVLTMPEVELRKRKKGQLSTPAGSTPSSKQQVLFPTLIVCTCISHSHQLSQPAGYSAVLQTYSRLLYIAFVLAGLCFVYFVCGCNNSRKHCLSGWRKESDSCYKFTGFVDWILRAVGPFKAWGWHTNIHIYSC